MTQPSQTRVIALVGVITGERRAIHTPRYPLDPSKMLPSPDVVLVVPGESGAMLYRYTAHGELSGDTWHATAADARVQAAREYGEALGPWVDVPEEVADAHEFAVKYALERLDSRGNW